MGKFLVGKKLGMTQLFDEKGTSIPSTVIMAGPCIVVQKKTVENDGYNAVRIGFEDIKETKLNKPDNGIYKKAEIAPKKYLREFRVDNVSDYEIGQELKVSEMFAEGDIVDVTGTSKGKGYAGTIKRYGTARGRETHGSHFHRRPGSMGAASSPSRVFKGKKLPGHMGTDRVTVQNLRVVKVDDETKVVVISGAVPGPRKGLIIIKQAVKA